MRTKRGTAHRHKTIQGKWSDLTDEVSGSFHDHEMDLASMTTEDIALLREKLGITPLPEPPEPEPEPAPPAGIVRTIGPADSFQGAVNQTTIDTLVLNPGNYRPGYVVLPNRPESKPLRIVAQTRHTAILGGNDCKLVGRVGSSYTSTQGLAFDSINPGDSGVFVFGGYNDGGCHHIAHRDVKATRITGTAPNSHLVYISRDTVARVSEIDLEDFDFDCPDQSVAALHSYHNPNAVNVRARRWKVNRAYEAALLLSDLVGLLLEEWTVTNCKQAFDISGPTGVMLNITATGSGQPSRIGAGIVQSQVVLG